MAFQLNRAERVVIFSHNWRFYRLLRDDATSCLAVHTRVMILGTRFGRTHVLDALGNSLKGSK